MKVPQVGKTIVKAKDRYGSNIERPLSYKDISTDADGWVETSQYIPGEFDLVILKNLDKTKSGWRSGNVWDGMRIDHSEEFTHWKRDISL
jgi:hypothetical protein